MSKIDLLSDTEYDSLLKPVWDWLVIRDDPKESDIIFIFGSYAEPVAKLAANLYHKKIAPKIIVTGYRGAVVNYFKHHKQSQADFFKKILREENVPEQDIIEEDKSTNTKENVLFGMSKLQEENIFPKRVILITRPWHSRRCVATFKKFFPQVEIMSCPPEGGATENIDRPKEIFAKRMVDEIPRFREYADKGDLVPQPVPKDVLIAADQVKPYLEKQIQLPGNSG